MSCNSAGWVVLGSFKNSFFFEEHFQCVTDKVFAWDPEEVVGCEFLCKEVYEIEGVGYPIRYLQGVKDEFIECDYV